MKTLAETTHGFVTQLCQRGDALCEARQFEGAIMEYEKALSLLPEPRTEWQAATHILAGLGDAHFLAGAYDRAEAALVTAMGCPGGIGNPFLHLRLGQCEFKLGNRSKAADELTRAYMGGGAKIFDGEESEYFSFLKTVLREPAGGW